MQKIIGYLNFIHPIEKKSTSKNRLYFHTVYMGKTLVL